MGKSERLFCLSNTFFRSGWCIKVSAFLSVLFFQKRCRAAFGKTVGAALYACPHAPKGVSRQTKKRKNGQTKKSKPPMKMIWIERIVGVTGLEPATAWSQTRNATNCATPRKNRPANRLLRSARAKVVLSFCSAKFSFSFFPKTFLPASEPMRRPTGAGKGWKQPPRAPRGIDDKATIMEE